jgi:hypothetical protein
MTMVMLADRKHAIAGRLDLIAHFAQIQYDAPETTPGVPMSELNITAIVESFANQITAAVEASVTQRLQAAIAGAFGAPPKRGPGRPPKLAVAGVAPVAAKSAEKKTRPRQLCPVPGCKNTAAPIFGMVCKDHKNVAKSKIKKYREERNGKATTATAVKPVAAKKATKMTPKLARARKLQGQYLGALKSLKGEDKAKVKAVAKEKGVAEAVKLALGMK